MKKDKSFFGVVQQRVLKEESRKRKKKIRNRLQKLIKKHFFSKPILKFDLKYIVRVVTMQESLAMIFKKEGDNLGKYNDLGFNLWTNDFLNKKKKFLEKMQLPEGESIEFNLGQNDLNNFDSLFGDKLKSLAFYEDAKQGRVVENDDDKKIHQEFREKCK